MLTSPLSHTCCAYLKQIYNGNPVFHQAAYGLMQLVSTTQVVRLLRSKTSPLSQKQRKEISRLFWLGTVLFGGAFGLWKCVCVCVCVCYKCMECQA